jgi:BTB/POZ domain
VRNIPRQPALQVEDQLFKVPRYHFARHSEIFEATFSLPQSAGSDPEGSTDSAPIRLEAVDKGDFQTLLEVMYPL